jgi:hypothetical protein
LEFGWYFGPVESHLWPSINIKEFGCNPFSEAIVNRVIKLSSEAAEVLKSYPQNIGSFGTDYVAPGLPMLCWDSIANFTPLTTTCR